MNYIMGFLLVLMRDNELAFNAFNGLMKNYCGDIFIKDMQGLKKLFY